MPRTLARQVPIPSVAPPTLEKEYNDYSKGMNNHLSNDAHKEEYLRLAKNARIVTLGEYETRKGINFYSNAVGNTLRDSETSTTGASTTTFSTTTWAGVKFTATGSEKLDYVRLKLLNDASATGNIVVAVYTNNAGAPGTLVTKTTIKANAVPTVTVDYVSAYFADGQSLSATDYWLVAYTQTGGSGSYKWATTTNSTDAATSANSGTSWTTRSYSFNYYLYTASDYYVKGLHRISKSDGTTKTLMTVHDTVYSVAGDGTLSVIKSGLNTSSTATRGVVVQDTFYYVNGYDGLRKWDFSAESQVNTNNYSMITEHKGMLFLVDKDDPNKLVFSNFANYETYTSTDFIYVPSPKTGDPITALVSLNGTLVIFTRYNKYILYGDDNATYQLQQAPGRKGTYSPDTVSYDKNFVYFLSDDGVYRFNGTVDELVSKNNYEEVRQQPNKEHSVVLANKGRLYVWHRASGVAYNSKCFVYNINFGDSYESYDTNTYVRRAVIDVQNDGDIIVGSSVLGKCWWYELASNDASDEGQGYEFRLETHNMHFGTPSREKEIRYWKPRLKTGASSYTITCAYATDLTDSFTTQSSVNTLGSGTAWGSGATWGSFEWGASEELQSDLQVAGDFRRIAIAYYHSEPRQPHLFYGHTFRVEMRDMR